MAEAAVYFLNLLILSVVLVPFCHYFLGQRSTRILLSLTGAYLLYIVAPRLLLFYVPYWVLVWAAQALLHRLSRGAAKSFFFWTALAAALAPMVVWKLFPLEFTTQFNLKLHALTWEISKWFGELDAIRYAVIPLGLSFGTFRALDVLIQAHLGVERRLSLLEMLFYGLFPPVLFVGPIAQFSEVAQREKARLSEDVAIGAQRIVVGLVKVYVLALPIAFSQRWIPEYGRHSQAALWASTFLFAWHFYLNFAGYSDIAIGLARLYGFRLKENFDYPFFKPNVQQFWASWHMSLTRFAQRNIFVPAGGYRAKTQYLALCATMMVIALWHGLTWSWVIYGVYHALGLCVNRYYSGLRGAATPPRIWGKGLATLTTFFFVMVSLPLVLLPLGDVVPFYQALFLGR